jgi:threonylcarbamoyladenosine tRNA methylthiotransferase MtaB
VRFSVLSFGCRTNQADSCRIERRMIASGGASADPAAADVVVINTCTVTAAADRTARSAIRRAARLNPGARILVTGCYAERQPDEIGRLPRATVVPRLAETLPAEATGDAAEDGAVLGPGDRGRTAYPLRVQTGCDGRCAYCIVPATRGPGRSLPIEAALGEVRGLSRAGFKEIWLTGVHLGSWGRDLTPAASLIDLLRALDGEARSLDVTFRLGSLEPMDCGEAIVDLVAESPRFARHLHLPLQHASDGVLAAMRRPYDFARYRDLVSRVRDRMPEAAIGTDLMAGFPGETGRDFDIQSRALAELPLTHVHVFPYSARPGTAAASMAGRVPAAEIRRRADALGAIGREQTRRFYERMVGRELAALTRGDGTTALTENGLRLGIDRGRARNERVRVRVTSADPPRGEVIP